MTADPIARGVGLTLGVLLGLAVVLGMATPGALGQDGGAPEWYDEPALPAEREAEPTWLYQLPAEPAPPADPERPAEPAPLTELPETA